MTPPRPDVSVVIPVYNRTAPLVRAVRSCLEQTGAVEIIVVDDGSAEDIRAALETRFPEELASPALQLIRQPNQGACVARNEGLAHATGEWIKFLDSDDELIPGTLAEEVHLARESGCDALLTGWEERTARADGREDSAKRQTRPAPNLDRGIDDMLDGKGATIAAVLYKTEFVKPLRWDPAWIKAQDWGWLLTVCLAGARFASLDRPSCIYHHHAGERITSTGDIQLRSTRARQGLLRMVERELRAQDALTDSRKRQLAQYFYRDCQMLARHDPAEWRRVWTHCEELCPGFRPRDPNRILRIFTRLLGVHAGVKAYVRLKALLFRLR